MHLAISSIQGISTKRTVIMDMENVATIAVTYTLGNGLTALSLTVRGIHLLNQIQHAQSLKSKMEKEEKSQRSKSDSNEFSIIKRNLISSEPF